jgi:hypothetical protein
MGKEITSIIPCLNPDTPESQKIDIEVMSERVTSDRLVTSF